MTSIFDLLRRRSKPARAGDTALSDTQADLLIPLLPGWHRTGREIHKTYSFPDFYRTMGFVNAVAFIANQENHHPDLEVSYGKVRLRFSTHDVQGLSENDFICAAKVEALANTPWTDGGAPDSTTPGPA